jgi:hypothetical protein
MADRPAGWLPQTRQAGSDNDAGHQRHPARGAEQPKPCVNPAASECTHGIGPVVTKCRRHFIADHVAQHTAKHAGRHAHQDGDQHRHLVHQRQVNAAPYRITLFSRARQRWHSGG